MAGTTEGARKESEFQEQVPRSFMGSLKFVGPGLVVAATGVGAGDMVSSLSAGTNFGTVLI
ncbi:MAG: hypothetical protein ACR2N0_09785 [Rubrobacteraceae bacterium]|jgi:Mn2+/Fe2+ NRAMP family transporter